MGVFGMQGEKGKRMSEYIINDEQIKEAVEFTPPYKTLSYAAKYKVSGAVEIQGVAVHGLPGIVRCRDCKYARRMYDEDGNGIPDMLDCYGRLTTSWDYYNDEPQDNPVEPDGYCAWGERE